MGRPRTGSAFEKGGRIIVQIKLRDDAPQKHWQTQCPPRPDGKPITLEHAKAVAADLQQKYDAGLFDPFEKEVEPEPEVAKEDPTVAEWATEWARAQTYERATKDQGTIKRYLVGSTLGSVRLSEVKPRHVAEWLKEMSARPSIQGGTLSPRTVSDLCKTLRRAMGAAVFSELLVANPCDAVPRSHAPGNGDKDPLAREGWVFTRGEVYLLMTSPALPADRRVVYALESLTGCRPGELATLRWKDWDRTITPLTRLMVARAQSSVTQMEGSTKTGAKKAVPVHPYLHDVLAAWFSSGWSEYVGRAPKADDLVVPNRFGEPRKTTAALKAFTQDLDDLGLEYRRHYALRHTFITQAQDDGASGEVLRWATHAPPSTAFAGYTRGPWKALCAEIVKLRVGPDEPPAGPAPGAGGGGGGLTASLTAGRKVKSGNATKQAVADQTRGRYQRQSVHRALPLGETAAETSASGTRVERTRF